MASFGTSTPGTRHSTSSQATSCTCRPTSGSTSGKVESGGSKMKSVRFLLIAGTALALASPAFADKPVYGDWGYDATAMDRAVKPGDDFFAYVNGTWYNKTPIAADRTFVGIDSVLNDQIDKDVRDIIEGAAKESSQSGIDQQIGDFYASWMDQAGIEAKGLA